ncbi:MAG: hypothetical protein QF692_08215 [Alphaproteobacteria bacterium]|nr:hypothetical protein [Alphaproteobacteria bacterium]MDP7223229.1 hypothetical protein [Alphaproteobacteria bacterium]
MAKQDKYSQKFQSDLETVPFTNAEEAWFWFIQAQTAKSEGARVTAGSGVVPRPCEPADILNILNRLYRNRKLLMDHLLVLRHYGKRLMAPDFTRVKEMRAHTLWHEALETLEDVLIEKRIVKKRPWFHVDKDETHVMEAAE